MEAARAASRTKHSYFHSQYSKIAARRGHNRASVAVAHSLLIVIYHMLCTKSPYIELGEDYFDKINKEAKVQRLLKKVEALGYTVTKQETSA